MSTTLVIAGSVAKVAGVVLIAWPDARPFLTRFSKWLRERYVRAGRWARRALERVKRQTLKLLRRPTSFEIRAESGVVIVDGGPVTFTRISGRTPDEKIASLAGRITELERNVDERIGEALAAADEERRPLRFLGAFLLVAGAFMLAVGTIA